MAATAQVSISGAILNELYLLDRGSVRQDELSSAARAVFESQDPAVEELRAAGWKVMSERAIQLYEDWVHFQKHNGAHD